jgi:hypothetical protein
VKRMFGKIILRAMDIVKPFQTLEKLQSSRSVQVSSRRIKR